jgi:glycosyltransferase involved in cell wall biosynthesis
MTKLLIISHTPHYCRNGEVVGWGPTVREIDNLSRLFERIFHLAVLYPDNAPSSSLAYEAGNVEFIPISPAGGENLADKLGIVRSYPGYLQAIHHAVNGLHPTDLIHVRCPANISLLALFYLIFRFQPSRRWVKYAGNWSPDQKDEWSYRLQRWLLCKNWPRGVVTINGRWANQPAHLHSFLNPSLTQDEYKEAVRSSTSKQICEPLNLLFVGRLEDEKGTQMCLQIVEMLILKKVQIQMTLVGDGPLRQRYEDWVMSHGLGKYIHFTGWLPKPSLAEHYSTAHILIFPTLSEGWPKVLSEAMAYGVVPVTSAISSIPQTLTEFKVGQTFSPLDLDAFVNAILLYLADPARWKRESCAGVDAASHFTYDIYLERLKAMFGNAWGLELPEA